MFIIRNYINLWVCFEILNVKNTLKFGVFLYFNILYLFKGINDLSNFSLIQNTILIFNYLQTIH